MQRFVCTQCGIQFGDSLVPPPGCPICEDERQYVNWEGQDWTTLQALRRDYKIRFEPDHGMFGIGCTPHFAIGQRALLVPSPGGNVLWDCIALLTDDLVTRIRAAGGIKAIAISHPHYYTTMVEWAEAFDAPVYLHADDAQWVVRPDKRIVFWQGELLPLDDEFTLIRCGGHFDGGAVLHRRGDGGALFVGDVLQVAQDRRYVSFMRSFPNYIPLGPGAVRRIKAALDPFAFERIYGAFWGKVVAANGKAAVERSVKRYLDWIAV